MEKPQGTYDPLSSKALDYSENSEKCIESRLTLSLPAVLYILRVCWKKTWDIQRYSGTKANI